ncbi:Regulator of Vps4 activity in the MVB pathway protein [Abeliophyllum distichum]|uniref:Regulator of Vps4 activity in the MVB pathway protein n=1 Tax=Abeliophyllum distichum TaxID=126358 RepID=A0ABD1SA06_9LAMI
MSMLDSFMNKAGFKAAKCKTLLKLTIPRIKLLRNRREIQLKQMRREIAKLLETGQEATARIRVEHIIREEKMMAAQEIVELFCELIAVRLPIIEAQRECPLDLKEAISSVCFAAPRCADLPELLQVQMLFAGKYGKEFVASATELLPECGVNRQLVELLSVRAPAPNVKLKLLKEIAAEHELDWDPSASETELLKPHEDLLSGPTQFVSGSKLPLHKEKHDEPLYSASKQDTEKQSDSDADFEILDFPEVPKQPLQSSKGTVSAPEMLPFPASALSETYEEDSEPSEDNRKPSEEVLLEKSVSRELDSPNNSLGPVEDKQFVPFISPPSQSSASVSRQGNVPLPVVGIKSENNVDLQDVLAAAQAAADSAECAAAAARSAASLAQLRISELVKKNNDEVSDGRLKNAFHGDKAKLDDVEKPILDNQSSFGSDSVLSSPSVHRDQENYIAHEASNLGSCNLAKGDADTSSNNHVNLGTAHQPQRLPSMDDETYFSYPNLFARQSSNLSSHAQSFTENSRSTQDQ